MNFGFLRKTDFWVVVALLTLGVLSSDPFVNNLNIQELNDSQVRTRDFLGWFLLASQVIPLYWRSTSPRIVLWVIIAAWSVERGLQYGSTLASFALLLAMWGIGAYLTVRQAWRQTAIAIGVLGGWTAFGLATGHVPDGVAPSGMLSFVDDVLSVVLPMLLGLSEGKRRRKITELELAAQANAQADAAGARRAVRAERIRIARELHDVVAHEMTVMTLQAEGARRLAVGGDQRVVDALATISESGRNGLTEMQRMIGVLRSTDDDRDDDGGSPGSEPTVGVPAVSDHMDLAPMPALASIPTLVQQVVDAGMPVELHITGNAHVPASVELSAYRIVQESLTNALKYAGEGASATVNVERALGELTITVEDDGRGTFREAVAKGSGHGLSGMRERTLALGGTIEFGPRPGGGFRVRAHLPTSDDIVIPVKKASK